SYCIIPSTRGAPTSVPLPAVVDQINRVVSAGFKEIVLTGVHLGSYGRDFTPPSSLIQLLETLDATGSRTGTAALLRISSLEPMDCQPAIIDLVAASDRFAP